VGDGGGGGTGDVVLVCGVCGACGVFVGQDLLWYGMLTETPFFSVVAYPFQISDKDVR
jgi:hypothetical protein